MAKIQTYNFDENKYKSEIALKNKEIASLEARLLSMRTEIQKLKKDQEKQYSAAIEKAKVSELSAIKNLVQEKSKVALNSAKDKVFYFYLTYILF